MTLLAHFTVAKGKILALSAFVISKHINHHLLQSLRPLSDELDERMLIFCSPGSHEQPTFSSAGDIQQGKTAART
jgi:hypothetical protein